MSECDVVDRERNFPTFLLYRSTCLGHCMQRNVCFDSLSVVNFIWSGKIVPLIFAWGMMVTEHWKRLSVSWRNEIYFGLGTQVARSPQRNHGSRWLVNVAVMETGQTSTGGVLCTLFRLLSSFFFTVFAIRRNCEWHKVCTEMQRYRTTWSKQTAIETREQTSFRNRESKVTNKWEVRGYEPDMFRLDWAISRSCHVLKRTPKSIRFKTQSRKQPGSIE